MAELNDSACTSNFNVNQVEVPMKMLISLLLYKEKDIVSRLLSEENTRQRKLGLLWDLLRG